MHSQRQPYSRLNPLLPASMIAHVEAEAEGAEALAEKRKYELEWARLAVLEDFGGSG